MKKVLAENIHVPVMMSEVLGALSPKQGDFIIDGTLGGGGHAMQIASMISPNGIFLGVDRDASVIEQANINVSDITTIFVRANYVDLPNVLTERSLPLADGLLLDLGFSSNQLISGRGFSFLIDEPLIMTYSDDDEPLHLALRRLNKEDLKNIISVSGERYARAIAEAIWQAKRKSPITTTGELVKIIRGALPAHYERGRIHPATRTFLALRIYINKELENLETIIDSLQKIIKKGGRVAIITFQSLEDRIVKNKFQEMARDNKITLLFKKPLTPKPAEIKINRRTRSAKLRAAIIH